MRELAFKYTEVSQPFAWAIFDNKEAWAGEKCRKFEGWGGTAPFEGLRD